MGEQTASRVGTGAIVVTTATVLPVFLLGALSVPIGGARRRGGGPGPPGPAGSCGACRGHGPGFGYLAGHASFTAAWCAAAGAMLLAGLGVLVGRGMLRRDGEGGGEGGVDVVECVRG